MKKLIKQNLGGKKILFLFVLTNIVYASMLLITIPQVMQFSDGMALLDMMPAGYSHAYVRTLFDTLGEPGRNAYLYRQIPLDMLYPGLFGVSYCLIMAYFLNKLDRLDSKLFYLCLIPVFSAVFDYGENIGIITMLGSYPDISGLAAQTTAVFSVLKSTSTSLYFIALLLVLIALGKARWLPTAPRH
jgi:hypothetical protein